MAQTLSEDLWQRAIVGYIKKVMRKTEADYPELARRLATAGVQLDRRTLSNKLNRGAFGAGFLLQVLAALGEQEQWLDQVANSLEPGDSGD